MDVSIEHAEGLNRRLKVEIPAERVREAVDAKVRRAGQHARVPGFRPGKAPMKVLYSRYGARARQEAVGELIESVYPQAVEQARLNPAGQPEIELDQFEAGAPLAFTARFDVYPEIELTGLDAIRVERPVFTVTDADVAHAIARIQDQNKTWAAVERESRDGDRVAIDFTGRIDGEVFEGGTGEDVKVDLGAGEFLPDLERALVGRRSGEAFVSEVVFPDDYGASDLAGKTARFEVTVKSVSQPQPAELDDAFLEKLGIDEGGLDALQRKVRESLQNEAEQAAEARVKTQVMDALRAANPIQVPASMVAQEIERMRAEAMQRMPEPMRQNEETAKRLLPDDALRDDAERRVALALLTREVIAEKNLELDDERMQAKITAIAAGYGEQAEAVKQYYQSNSQLRVGLQAMVMEEQVIDALLADATVTEKEIGVDELLNANHQ